MTAFILPILVTATLGGVSVTMALAKRQELTNIAQLACSRAIKPTRMKILTDANRTAHARTYFNQLAAERKIHIDEVTVTSGWLTAHVTAKATIPVVENVSQNAPSFHASASVSCEGLPPFPKKDDTILSSNFTKPGGDAIQLGRDAGVWCKKSWDVYNPTAFGWEGGTGPGVEIQDWTRCNYGTLPAGSLSKYVVELDSTGNSSMYRTVELHKGTYRFSFWYFGRQPDKETNRVSVYLEGVRPASPEARKLLVERPRSDGWVYEQFEITVDTYSLYKLTIKGEGASDGNGGNFNDLKMEYIKRPGEV